MKKRTTRFSYRLAVSAALVLSCVLAYGQVETPNPTAPFWKVNGNSGTTNGTNFVGTTDAQSLDIRTNNVIRVRITQKGQIEVLNTGQSVFVGEGAGNADDLSNNNGVFIGYNAGTLNTTGFGNSFVGWNSGASNIAGASNTGLGYYTLYNNTNSYNTAVGYIAMFSNTTAPGNTAVGYATLVNNTTGEYNTTLGFRALSSNIDGSNNVAIGNDALFDNTTADYNIGIGYSALVNNTTGDLNVAIGPTSLSNNVTGTLNVAIGVNTLFNSTGNNNTAVGAAALFGTTSGYSNTAIGTRSGVGNTTGNRNTFLGDSANVTVNNFTNAIAIGWNARVGQSNSMLLGSIQGINGSTATVRVGIGVAVPARALHIGNDTLGFRYEGVSTGGDFVTTPAATTDKILFADANGDVRAMNAGNTNDVLMYTASGPAWGSAAANSWGLTGNAGTTNGTNFIGTTDAQDFDIRTNNVLRATFTQKGQIEVFNTGQSVFLGEGAGNTDDLTTNMSTFIGYSAGIANTTGFGNVYVGNLTGATSATGGNNTAVGTAALRDNTASFNTALGYSAARSTTTGTGNTAVGYIALFTNTTGSNNTAIGLQALNSNSTGTHNVAVGANALYNNTASDNVAVGSGALQLNTSGLNNTALGRNAVRTNATGHGNTGVGFLVMENATGSYNTALGATALQYSTGFSNTGVGYIAGSNNTTGTRNSFLGDSANVTSGVFTNATAIGWNARVAQSNSMLLGSIQGVSGSTATVRVGIGTDAPARALHLGNDTLGFRYEGVSTGGSFITAPNAVNDRILFANGNGDVSAMPAGNNGDVLTFTASGPAWSASGTSTAWELTGNAGTVDGTNFIGTTDGIPFTVRVNNIASGRIDHTNSNAFWGYSSGGAITATFNTAIGHQAMFSNSTGLGNTALGAFALHSGTSGQSNVAIGLQTMSMVNTGNSNTAVGTNAMLSNTGGGNNTALGYQAMYNNTTGRANIGIGVRALYSNSTLIQQIAIGDSALYSNNAGSGGNTAVGYKALRTNASGNFNTALGYSAGAAVTASNNTTLGYANFSGASSYGSSNTSVGSQVSTTSSAGSGNAFVGMGIPNAAFSVGDDNVLLGLQAGNWLSGTVDNQNVIIGSTAGLRTTGSGNSGNVIVGTLAYLNDAPALGTLTNNVLLGYTARAEGNTNNTVIGGNAKSTPSTANTNTTVIGANAQVTAVNNFILGDTISRPQVGIGVTAVGKTLTGTRFEIASENTMDNMLFRYHGTGTPTFHFQRAQGTLALPTAVTNGVTLGRFDFYGYDGSTWDVASSIITEVDSVPSSGIVPTRIRITTQSSTGSITEQLRIDRRGNVGIAETNPRVPLHINGGADAALTTVESGYLMIGNETSTNLLFDDNEIMARSNSGVSNLALQGEGGSVWVHQVGAVDADDFMITADANVRVGIGVGQFPAYQLELAQNSGAKPGGGDWTNPSDRRLKKDIVPFTEGVSVLQQIKPVWYTYNGKGNIRDTSRFVGIIAQEMQEVAPYMISTSLRKEADSTFTEYLDYNGSALTYILVNSVKEQQVTIDQLKARIEQQQLEIEELKRRN